MCAGVGRTSLSVLVCPSQNRNGHVLFILSHVTSSFDISLFGAAAVRQVTNTSLHTVSGSRLQFEGPIENWQLYCLTLPSFIPSGNLH